MFNDTIVVQSAVSAFNNAALMAPAFFWWAVLALPMFFVIWLCANTIMGRIGWSRENIVGRGAGWCVGLTLVWVVLFGGNYGALRDDVSVLPFVTAAIVMAASVFIGNRTRNVRIPRLREMARGVRLRTIGIIALVLVLVGASDMHAWWGPILQIGAMAAGLVVGRRLKRDVGAMTWVSLMVVGVVSAILMQPEFFRFGQLGNLTAFHLLFLGVTGATAVATLTLRNVNARGRIHHSAFVKLKWMVRFVCALGVVLFIMTESVPVFLGMLGAMGIMFAMSIWHRDVVDSKIAECMFMLAIGLFGVVTSMPAVTAIGILGWSALGGGKIWRGGKFLL